jgi:uncharacterized protein (DUF58 family)
MWMSNRLFPRKLSLTREGKFLVVLTLGVGFAAINTGNNLLYLVLGMLLSLMVSSGVLSELTLRKVAVERGPVDAVPAGEDTLVRVTVRNQKRFFASYSLEVTEVFEATDGVLQAPGQSLRLGPGESATVFVRIRFSHRGEYESAGLAVATRFPFSFFRKSRYWPEAVPYLAHPRQRATELPTLPARQLGQDTLRPRAGTSGDLYGVRPFRHGDSMRDVHWKSTARRGRLVAKELEQPAARTVLVAMPSTFPEGADPALFELRVERAAGVAVGFLERGFRVGLVTHDGQVSAESGAGQRRRLLDHLARLVATTVPPGRPGPPLRVEAGDADLVNVEAGHA